MAVLWERRLNASAKKPDVDPTEEITTLELHPTLKPLRQSSRTERRPRLRVSAKKPPVPPPLATGAITMSVEEVLLSDAMLEGLSPVSSFLSSEPGSPGPLRRVPTSESDARSCVERGIDRNASHCRESDTGGNVWEEIVSLRDMMDQLDHRMSTLEQRNQRLLEHAGRLGVLREGE